MTYYRTIKGNQALSLSDRRLVFVLAALPFIINDPFFAWIDTSSAFYIANYGLRITVVALCLWWSVSRQMVLERPLPTAPVSHGLLAVFVLPAICWCVFWYFVAPLGWILGAVNQTSFPEIETPGLVILNLTLGLLLISFTEELIFRKLSYAWLSKAGLSQGRIVLWSAAIFSFTHWSGGFTPLLNTFIFGALYMIAYIKLGRLWPLVIAHWLHNFIYLGLY